MKIRTGLRAGAAVMALTAPAAADTQINGLQQMMLFRSFIQDDALCETAVVDGRAMITGANATSGAAACPDAFAWAQFVNAVSDEFWTWGIDQTIWPEEPWPLCTAEITANCCDPNAAVDPAAQPANCPVYRADYDPISPLPATPNGTPSGEVVSHNGLNEDDNIDPGRLLRDLELELVFRNRAMTDYIYRNDLYSREGLGSRNRAQNAALKDGNVGAAHSLEVRFPLDATMVKVDFLHQDIMLARELIMDTGGPVPNNPEYPYLTVYLDGDGDADQVPGFYYVVAMTNASKDLPTWHWYAMEHVANAGRCDYIGCNDSFGYTANGAAQAGANFGDHYVPPAIMLNNDKTEDNDPLFATGGTYLPADTGEQMTEALAMLFEGTGVGAAPQDPDPRVISADDPAWKNYYLKGTQSSFTTVGGVPTGMGATVTEGGFVNSASCTTCHSQAAADMNGTTTKVGVGATWRPNLLGYAQVAMGTPSMDWFYQTGLVDGGPGMAATQIDFVWGILNAACQSPAGSHGQCDSYPDAPTVIRATGSGE
ncbi:hypothetical protein ACN2XU_13235 [Primorskyibacter sp. 2E107]|uniref:hypothetical protein n=1 Tax=Primorskyibacter sp. 2E107 TaxID=3403458 RepID=UPI003AF996D4